MSIGIFDLNGQHIHDLIRDMVDDLAVSPQSIPPRKTEFRIKHQKDRELLDWLTQNKYIREITGNLNSPETYYVSGVVCALSIQSSLKSKLPDYLDRIYITLRDQYEKHIGPYLIEPSDISSLTGLLSPSVSIALLFMTELGVYGYCFDNGVVMNISVDERILDASRALEFIAKYRIQSNMPGLLPIDIHIIRLREFLRIKFNLRILDARYENEDRILRVKDEQGETEISIVRDLVDDLNAESLSEYSRGGKNILEALRAIIEPQLIQSGLLLSRQSTLSIDSLDRENTGTTKRDPKAVFIIHGHDETNLSRLKDILEKLGLIVIILRGEPNKGRFLLEKFQEEAGKAAFAFALITPDDVVKSKPTAEGETYSQARPNVLFELGWCFRDLKRERVCIIMKRDTVLHSDIQGMGYIEFDESVDEKIEDIKKELREAGMLIAV